MYFKNKEHMGRNIGIQRGMVNKENDKAYKETQTNIIQNNNYNSLY